jgi:hypothetical protein
MSRSERLGPGALRCGATHEGQSMLAIWCDPIRALGRITPVPVRKGHEVAWSYAFGEERCALASMAPEALGACRNVRKR